MRLQQYLRRTYYNKSDVQVDNCPAACSVDWDDDTWEAETHEGVPLTSSEEDLTLEVNSEDDEDSDEEYVHPVCVR